MTDHTCNQSTRFDSLEEAIKGIHETLKQLTELLVAKAASDTKLDLVLKSNDDHEDRIRKLESRANAGLWLERLVWAVVVAAVLAYFKL